MISKIGTKEINLRQKEKKPTQKKAAQNDKLSRQFETAAFWIATSIEWKRLCQTAIVLPPSRWCWAKACIFFFFFSPTLEGFHANSAQQQVTIELNWLTEQERYCKKDQLSCYKYNWKYIKLFHHVSFNSVGRCGLVLWLVSLSFVGVA